jgi:hypothetical protein
MRKILLTIFLICLILSGFSRPAMAGGDPVCPVCEYWDPYTSRCRSVYCGSGNCMSCVNGSCQLCYGIPGLTCCNGSCCDTGDESKCLSCVDGGCWECNHDPEQACCRGAKQCRHWRTEQCCWNTWELWATVCSNELGCCYGVCYDYAAKYCCNDGPPGGHRFYLIDIDKQCCNGSSCDPANCETCIDGECKVCGGDPTKTCCNGSCCNTNQKCCDGSCCNKDWTKETVAERADTCGSCNSSTGYCANMIINSQSYEKCKNVGGGGGEHCQCNETMQVVGYIYLCNENWDISKMAWCLAQGAWCAAECYLFRDPAGCANCLAGIDCCGGPCEVCDFVEECYPFEDALNEIQDLVFTGFGC